MEALAWSIGAIVAARIVGGDTGRVLGLVSGALLAHLGWIVVHLPDLVKAAMAAATIEPIAFALQVLDPTAGTSMLFVPAGPMLVRWVQGESGEALDADLRALMPGLAVARLGCVVAGCCGGRIGAPALGVWPTAELSVAGLALLALVARRPGRASIVLAGFGALRLTLQPLRVAPPHGGEATWVYAVAVMWIVVGLAVPSRLRREEPRLRSRRPRRSPRAPDPSSCRGPWRRRHRSPGTFR